MTTRYRNTTAGLVAAAQSASIRGQYNGKIVFSSNRHSSSASIWTMNPDGSGLTRLTDGKIRSDKLPIYVHVSDGGASWTPDGTRIAFLSNRSGNTCLYTMNADGSDMRQVLGYQGDTGNPVWSPDGTKITFSAGIRGSTDGTYNYYLYTVNADGSNLTQLTHAPSGNNHWGDDDPSWSPDGTQIYFDSTRDIGGRIYVMNSDGSNQRKLIDVHNTSDPRFYWDAGPAVSPDGTKIAFYGSRDDNGARNCEVVTCGQIYVMNIDGSNEMRLTSDFNLLGDGGAKWSPDGKKILFGRSLTDLATARMNKSLGSAIVIMDADGSNQVNISNRIDPDFFVSEYNADWQPLTTPADVQSSVVGFSSSSYSAYEDSGSIAITVTRAGNLNATASCYYATEDGTATVKYNYAPVFGTLQFAPGEASKTILIPLADNGSVMGDRWFKISLWNNEGNASFLGGIREATVTVLDRDTVPRASNPIDDTRYFVRQNYVDFLNREPDPPGWQFWTNNIDSCGLDSQCRATKTFDTSAAFFLSIEFQETGFFVLRFKVLNPQFNCCGFPGFMRDTQELGRSVIVGQDGWQDRLEANKTAFIQRYFDEDRVAVSWGFTNDKYVDLLFQYAQVTPAQTERDALVAGLNNGTLTRPAVFRTVMENEQFKKQLFNEAFVLMEYWGYLRRDPDSLGFDFWLKKLNFFNGNYTQAEMVKAFVTSIEYRSRFGPP